MHGKSENLALAALEFHPSEVAARGSIEHSLRETLWKTQYGPVYYRGYVDSAGLLGVTFSRPTPIRQDAPERPKRKVRHKLAIASGAVSVASLAAFGASLWLTLDAKQSFDRTDQEKRALKLRESYQRRLIATFATGALSIATGATAVLLWPRVVFGSSGTAQIGLDLSGRF